MVQERMSPQQPPVRPLVVRALARKPIRSWNPDNRVTSERFLNFEICASEMFEHSPFAQAPRRLGRRARFRSSGKAALTTSARQRQTTTSCGAPPCLLRPTQQDPARRSRKKIPQKDLAKRSRRVRDSLCPDRHNISHRSQSSPILVPFLAGTTSSR
jgi:hypothetical protein